MIRECALLVSMCAIILMVSSLPAFSTNLENDSLLIDFDDNGNLTRIFNKVSSTDYYHGKGKRIITVRYLQDKTLYDIDLKLQSMHKTHKSNTECLELRFAGSGVIADIKITAESVNPKTNWHLKLSNSGDLRVVEVGFPELDNLYIGNDSTDDMLVRPNRYGERIPNPTENLFRKAGEIINGLVYQDWWNNPRLEYAGEAGMFWMDLYDESGGLYLASEDKSFIGGYLENGVNNGVAMSLGKYIGVKHGQSISLDYAVGVHTGDWHWGADRYREWADTFMRKAYIPRWVREMPNWYWLSSIWSLTTERPSLHIGFMFNEIDKWLYDNAISLGGNVIGMSGIEFMGHDYPLWWPDPSLGTEDELRRANRNVNRRGGKVVPYINPIYSWENYPNVPHAENPEFQERLKQIPPDVKQPFWDFYRNFYAMKYDGTPNYVEMNYYGNYPQMCMTCKEWQDYILWWTHKYAVDYGFNGVQWDQLGAYPDQYCVNEKHGHRHGGVGPIGTLELCKRIYGDREYKVGKDFYIWYEGASDIYSQYLQNCHSGFDAWMAWGFPEMIRYTFPHNFYSGEYFNDPTAEGPALIRNKRSAELSILGRYKLGVGQWPDHAYKLYRLSPMVNALKGIYWYTDYKGDQGCIAPQDVWTNVLEIDTTICPYISNGGYIIPYVDLRKNKGSFTLGLSRDKYDLQDITRVYWYPAFLQGGRKELSFKLNEHNAITIAIPDDDGMNAFTMDQAYCSVDDTISNVGMVVMMKDDISPITIISPNEAKREQGIMIKTVKQDIEGSKAQASIDMQLPDLSNQEIEIIPFQDGIVSLTEKAGFKCMEIKGGNSPYLYFRPREDEFRDGNCVLEVQIEYLDTGNGTFTIQYNSSDLYAMPDRFGETSADYKTSSIQFKQNTGSWKSAKFILPDANLSGRMNGGADIRMKVLTGSLDVSKIAVTKKLIKETPVPNAVVMVGNDKRRTNADGVLQYHFAPTDPTGAYVIEAFKDDQSNYLPARTIMVVQ